MGLKAQSGGVHTKTGLGQRSAGPLWFLETKEKETDVKLDETIESTSDRIP